MDELKKKYRRLIGTYQNEEGSGIKPMFLFVTADEIGYLHKDDNAEYESEFWTGIWRYDLLICNLSKKVA